MINNSIGINIGGVLLKKFGIKPLGFDDWLFYESNKKLNIEVTGILVNDIIDSKGRLLKSGMMVSINTVFDPSMMIGNIALVGGGWVPSLFALEDAELLLDRNVVSEFSARFDSGKTKSSNKLPKDIIDVLASLDFGCIFVLTFYSMEGGECRHPNSKEVTNELFSARNKIKKALPSYKILPEISAGGEHIINLINEDIEYFEKCSFFLQEINCILMPTVSINSRKKVWKEIIDSAHKCGLKTNDIFVFVAISAATARQGKNPAKNIIKPSHTFDEKDSYNAFMDIVLLRLLFQLTQTYSDKRIAVLTKDINLAKLWMGLCEMRTTSAEKEYSYDFNPHRYLIPLSEDELSYLLELLNERHNPNST